MKAFGRDPLSALFASVPRAHPTRFDPAAELAQKRLLARVLQRPHQVSVRLGRFDLVRCIGSGGMGTVFEAIDLTTQGAVALKIIEDASEQALTRLQYEFRALCDLSHAHLVTMYELHEERGIPFFTMELIRGPSLSRLLSARLSLSVVFVARCLRQLTAALATLHRRGVLHGDIKPSNLLVAPGGRLVVVDFGVARALHDTVHGGESGTPLYLSPERVRGDGLTQAGDWYAVGVVLRELLACVCAPRGQAARTLRDRLARLARGLQAESPAHRYGAPEVYDALGVEPPPLTSSWPAEELRVVGRERELALLRRARDAARTRLMVCTVRGEAGVGKTTLVEHFLALPEVEHTVTLRGRCYEAECLPYRGVDGVIEGLTRYLVCLSADRRSALAVGGTDALLEVFPRLSSSTLQSVQGAGVRALDTTPRQLRRRAFEQLCGLLAAITRERAVSIFIDDLQWADADGAALLSHLVAEGPPGLLLVVAFRDDAEGPAMDALRSVAVQPVEIAVGPLLPDACHQLMRAARGADTDFTASEVLRQESGGSPLLLLALLHTDRAAGDEARTYAQLVTRLVDALDAPARELLLLVVLAGCPLKLELLTAASRHAPLARPTARVDQVRLCLASLRARRLVRTILRDDLPHVVPHHDRVREHVVSRLSPAERRGVHARLAHAARVQAAHDPEFLAHHYFYADERTEAAQFAERAGDRARRTMALSRAHQLYQRALECAAPARPVALIEKLAEVAASAGDLTTAGPLYLEAVAARPDDSWELRLHAAEVLLQRGAARVGMDLLRPAMHKGRIPAPSSLLRALWTGGLSLARCQFFVRSPQRSLLRVIRSPHATEVEPDTLDDPRCELAFRVGHLICLHDPKGAALVLWSAARALSHGSSSQRGRALSSLAFVHALLGLSSVVEQDALVRQSLQMTSSSPLAHVAALASQALIAFNRCQCEQALSALATIRELTLNPHLDAQWLVGQLDSLEASVCVLAGDFLHIRELAPDAEKKALELGNRTVLAQLQSALAWAALAAGNREGMGRYTRAALREWHAPRPSPMYGIAVWGECNRLLYLGDTEGAHALMRAEAPRFARSGLASTQAWSITLSQLWGSVELTCSRTKGDAHARAAEKHARRLERHHLPVAHAFAALLRGGLSRRSGDTSSALAAYQRARRGFAALGLRGYAAAAAYREAQLGGARDDVQACSWFTSQSVAEPSSWVRMCAP